MAVCEEAQLQKDLPNYAEFEKRMKDNSVACTDDFVGFVGAKNYEEEWKEFNEAMELMCKRTVEMLSEGWKPKPIPERRKARVRNGKKKKKKITMEDKKEELAVSTPRNGGIYV